MEVEKTGVLNLSKTDKRSQTQTMTICKAQDKGIGKEILY
jgi:hypothetical protein